MKRLRVEHAAAIAHPILLLALGLSLSACDHPVDPDPDGPSTGTLVVSTSTGGDDPDPDGYLLTLDGIDSLDLDPTGTAQVDLVLDPNGTLIAQAAPGDYHLEVGHPANCSQSFDSRRTFTLTNGGTLNFEVTISCPP